MAVQRQGGEPVASHDGIERVFRSEYGRCVATLIRLFGDIDLAEEAVQDAFAVALAQWPQTGLPPNPGAWITTTARNRAIDRLRRDASRHQRHVQAQLLLERTAADEPEPEREGEGAVSDDRLRLIFTCCHPALIPNPPTDLSGVQSGAEAGWPCGARV